MATVEAYKRPPFRYPAHHDSIKLSRTEDCGSILKARVVFDQRGNSFAQLLGKDSRYAIPTLFARNRALNGDTVCVELTTEESLAAEFAEYAKSDDYREYLTALESHNADMISQQDSEKKKPLVAKVIKIDSFAKQNSLCRLAPNQVEDTEKPRTLFLPLMRNNPAVRIPGTRSSDFSASALYLISWDRSWGDGQMLPHGKILKVFEPSNFRNPKKCVQDAISVLSETYELEPQSEVPVDELKADEADAIKKIAQEIQTPSKSRVDRTGLSLFTIDPPESTDLDDAISVECLSPSIYKIGVHIADVQFAVRVGKPLDLYAQERGLSTYLPNSRDRFMMLPPALTRELSLNLGENRLAISVFFTVNTQTGSVDMLDKEPPLSIVRSRARLTYDDADKILNSSSPSSQPSTSSSSVTRVVARQLEWLKQIMPILAVTTAPAMDLSLTRATEPHFLFESGTPLEVKSIACDTPAHQLIEMLMIECNECVLHRMRASSCPVLPLRVQAAPQHLDQLIAQAVLKGADKPASNNLEAALKSVADANDKLQVDVNKQRAFQVQLMFFQQRALFKFVKLSDVDKPASSHFTRGGPYVNTSSPIRRYADIIAQRVMLGQACTNNQELADHLNNCQRLTNKAQREGDKVLNQILAALKPARRNATVFKTSGSRIVLSLPSLGIDRCEIDLGRLCVEPADEPTGRPMRVQWFPDSKPLTLDICHMFDLAICSQAWMPSPLHEDRWHLLLFPDPEFPHRSICTGHLDRPREFTGPVPIKLQVKTEALYRQSLCTFVRLRAIAEAMKTDEFPVIYATPTGHFTKVNDTTLSVILESELIYEKGLYAVCMRYVDEKPKRLDMTPTVLCLHGLAVSCDRDPLLRAKTVPCQGGAHCKKKGFCQFLHPNEEERILRTKVTLDLATAPDMTSWEQFDLGKWTVELIQIHPAIACIYRSLLGSRIFSPDVFDILRNPAARKDLPLNLLKCEDVKKLLQKSFKLNSGQTESVSTALSRPVYSIQGPPGTGKTTTAATLIAARLSLRPKEKILVCAPSNKAADVIAVQLAPLLHKLNETASVKFRMLRVYSRSIEAGDSPILQDILNAAARGQGQERKFRLHEYPETIRPDCLNLIARSKPSLSSLEHKYTNATSYGEQQRLLKEYDFALRDVEKGLMNSATVIISTCAISAERRIEGRDFPLVIIDECAQATEPEAVVAALHASQQLILIGDPRQIGPVLTSSSWEVRATSRTSLMERMLFPTLYRTLTEQYRMHAALREFPSNQFYHGMLCDAESILKRTPIARTFPWPNPDFGPLALVLVDGKELHPKSVRDLEAQAVEASNLTTVVTAADEINPFSYYNLEEAKAAAHCVRVLLKSCGTTSSDIAIISPYRAQRDKLTAMMKEIDGAEDIEIGTVHAFQGSERPIIIVSFVRSDESGKAGFIGDDRLFNVALTRAQHGMICLASPAVAAKAHNLKEHRVFSDSRGCLTDWTTFEKALKLRGQRKAEISERHVPDFLSLRGTITGEPKKSEPVLPVPRKSDTRAEPLKNPFALLSSRDPRIRKPKQASRAKEDPPSTADEDVASSVPPVPIKKPSRSKVELIAPRQYEYDPSPTKCRFRHCKFNKWQHHDICKRHDTDFHKGTVALIRKIKSLPYHGPELEIQGVFVPLIMEMLQTDDMAHLIYTLTLYDRLVISQTAKDICRLWFYQFLRDIDIDDYYIDDCRHEVVGPFAAFRGIIEMQQMDISSLGAIWDALRDDFRRHYPHFFKEAPT